MTREMFNPANVEFVALTYDDVKKLKDPLTKRVLGAIFRSWAKGPAMHETTISLGAIAEASEEDLSQIWQVGPKGVEALRKFIEQNSVKP